MNFEKLVKERNLQEFPVGLGGCRTDDFFFDICDFDVTVFDGKLLNDEFIEFENSFVNLHHGSLSESKSNILVQYENMEIIQDESWDLRIFLSKIKEKKSLLYKDHAKNCLIESLFCCEKAKQGIKQSSVFAPCWQKCASFFLADGILALNQSRSSPSHMLETLRKFDNNLVNDKLSVVNETIGTERSTPSLLERMIKSTVGLSDMFEKNNHSVLIQKKSDFFIKNSMLTDCYFYLGYVNRVIFTAIKNSVENQPDLIHILKVSFDISADSNQVLNYSDLIQKSANALLDAISR